MMQNEKMDERYLWIRGRVFQHGVFFTVVLLLANVLVLDQYGHWAPARYENLLMLWLIITFVSVELVWREVYIVAENRQLQTVLMMGVVGVILLGLNLYHLIGEGRPFASQGMLSADGSSLIMGCLIMLIPGAQLLRRVIGRTVGDKEE